MEEAGRSERASRQRMSVGKLAMASVRFPENIGAQSADGLDFEKYRKVYSRGGSAMD
jgi:hypothetical protein